MQKHISGDNTTIHKNLIINSSLFMSPLEIYAVWGFFLNRFSLSRGVPTHSDPMKGLCTDCLSFPCSPFSSIFPPKTNDFGQETQFLSSQKVTV